MTPETIAKLNNKYNDAPILRAGETPQEDEIIEAQSLLRCTFHPDYSKFLRLYGGGMVGSLPVYGLRPVDIMGDDWWSVIVLTLHYRNQNWPHAEECYVVSEDGRGNPIGITVDGRIMSYDHDVGDYYEVARDFESFVLKNL